MIMTVTMLQLVILGADIGWVQKRSSLGPRPPQKMFLPHLGATRLFDLRWFTADDENDDTRHCLHVVSLAWLAFWGSSKKWYS